MHDLPVGFVTALLCAQVLFSERYDATLNAPKWDVGGWNTHAGTYLMLPWGPGSHSGPGMMRFVKTDAGTSGALISPTTLTGSPGNLAIPPPEVHVRYWVRIAPASGEAWVWPLQVHDVSPGGSLAEAYVQPAGDGGYELGSRASDAVGIRGPGPTLPFVGFGWHLVQLDLEGLTTDAGRLDVALDGVTSASYGDLHWSSATANFFFTGFPSTHDSFIGAYDMDDLVVTAQRRAVFAHVNAPSTIDVGACVPFTVTFTDLDAGPLIVPEVSAINFQFIGNATVYGDSVCMSTLSGISTTGTMMNLGLRANAATNVVLTVSSPDLLGESVIVRAFDGGGSSVVDAGAPDAGAPDAGAVDAGTADAGASDAGPPDAGLDAGSTDAGRPDSGTPDAGVEDARLYTFGCGCNASPWPGLLALLMLVIGRRARSARR